MADQLSGDPIKIDTLEEQVVSFFVDGVKVLGMPRSIGEIYGLLFISQSALSLDDLVERLQISKGSASQGLKMLKGLGAVREASISGDNGGERRTYYEPAVDLKRLVGGFIGQQIRPHLDSGKSKIKNLASGLDEIDDLERKEFLNERLSRLDQWLRKGSRVLPVLQKILGQ